MRPTLSPHERYLVVRARNGWSVNLGADALEVYDTRADACEAARRRVASAIAAGRSADWRDTNEDRPDAVA